MTSPETMKKLQTLQQQALIYQEYLNIYKQKLIEINLAIDQLKKAKDKGETHAYQAIGANILLKRPIDDILHELEEDQKILTEKIKRVEKELTELKQKLGAVTKSPTVSS